MRTPADALRDPRPGDVSDTAPQPPPAESPVETLARLLEEAGAVPVICGIPLNTTLEERIALLLDRIAALEAQLAEAQERLAMVCNATWPWVEMSEPHREEWLTELAYRDSVEKWVRVKDALAATSEAVAQHTAEVERRGAKAALEAFAERDDWTLDVPRSLVDRIRRLLTAEARAAELEGA